MRVDIDAHGKAYEGASMTPGPLLTCGHCGALTQAVLRPGVGPHAARADCASCGHFLKWLPRVLVGGSRKETTTMVASVNTVTLLGQIGRSGIEVRYGHNGHPSASFLMVLEELGSDDKVHPLLVPCTVWGKKAEAAGELEAGQLALFQGKLWKKKKGEGVYELAVGGCDLTAVLPALVGSGNN
jgi:hypothetical protein